MRDQSVDPSLDFFRSAFMELQQAMVGTNKTLVALRRRASLCGIEYLGVTTTSETDESWS